MKQYAYAHVDVFAQDPLTGNGLAVVFCDEIPEAGQMLALAREFRQFETIFLLKEADGCMGARIFTMEGELPFAGHPILGGVAAVHARLAEQEAYAVCVRLAAKDVPVRSMRTDTGFHVEMAQGKPFFGETLPPEEVAWLLGAHNLPQNARVASLPVQVVSTGLPYVLIPVGCDLADARITVRDLEARIARYGASYTYLFNPDTLEARTWDNLGLVEDSATGSAAGPVCAYLAHHEKIAPDATIVIHQGRYANRPGTLHARLCDGEVYVAGQVLPFATGTFTL